MKFRAPVLEDRDAVRAAVAAAGYVGSDAAFGNLFLLRHKYQTLVAFSGGFLLRYYQGRGSRRGYTFPLGAGDPEAALAAIEADAQSAGRPLAFCLVTEEQKGLLLARFGERLHFEKDPGDGDYLYNAENLATLPGKAYQKKRNHVSRFLRAYPDAELVPITAENRDTALAVEEQWLAGASAGRASAQVAERSMDDPSTLAEHDAIREGLEQFDALGMQGALLMAEGKAVGMTMATEILPGVWDIHFEKVLGEYAANGGYAVINKLFAASLPGAKLLNREEDIGLEGLRKAKLSYCPTQILEKSYAAEV